MTDEENEWLERIRPMIVGMNPEAVGSINASGAQCLVREVDRLRIVACERDAHIDFLEGAMCDLLSEDAATMLMAQGAAEERARVVDIIVSDSFVGKFRSRVSTRQISDLLEVWPSTLPNLLPPLEARAALEAERVKVATLRAAMEDIAAGNYSQHLYDPTPRAEDIAARALEATKHA